MFLNMSITVYKNCYCQKTYSNGRGFESLWQKRDCVYIEDCSKLNTTMWARVKKSELSIMEQQGLGSVPALSKRFFFPMVKGGKDRLRTFLFKIVGCQHTQIEIKITWAVLPWAITGINKKRILVDKTCFITIKRMACKLLITLHFYNYT